MNRQKRLAAVLAVGLLIPALSIVCSSTNSLPFIATATPYPTYTPFPTFTPLPPQPTLTPTPERWSVHVLRALRAPTFGDLFFKKGDKYEYLIVTVQYSFAGTYTYRFFPMSVELVYPEGSGWPGFAAAAEAYQAEGDDYVMDFYNEPTLYSLIKPGETHTDKFAWTIPVGGEERYLLFFPEVPAIEIRPEN